MSNPRGGSKRRERNPIPIWTPFWKGFSNMWSAIFSCIPYLLGFPEWDWESIGFMVAILTFVAAIMGTVVGLVWVLT